MKTLTGLALSASIAPGAFSAIVIDGALDAAYGSPLSVQTENIASAFGGGNWLQSIYLSQDATNVYLFLEGNVSSGNGFVFFLDVVGQAGDDPNPIPAATQGTRLTGSQSQNILELNDIDYGFAGNSNDTNIAGAFSFFVDEVDYVDDDAATVNGPNDAGINDGDFLGSDVVSGITTDTSNFTTTAIAASPNAFYTTNGFSQITFAYSDADNNGIGVSPVEGWEIRIPRSGLGMGSTSGLRIFAELTNSQGFISRHVLPPATGHGNNTIGGPGADFRLDVQGTGGAAANNGAWGSQILGPFTVPAELSVFSAN